MILWGFRAQVKVVSDEVKVLSTELNARTLESTTFAQHLEELLDENDILRSHNHQLETDLSQMTSSTRRSKLTSAAEA